MEFIYWTLIIALFIIAFIGLVYPVIPSVLFIIGGFVLYGFAFSFSPLNIWFWIVQGFFVMLLFIADYLANIISVKKFGGSNASVWGSTIGIIIGPFVIPFAGIILGPFLGAILAEILVKKQDLKTSVKIGIGSVVGLFSSAIVKGIVQAIMIIYFIIAVL